MKKSAKDIAQILEERWPLLFNFNEPKPLKIGIVKDIQTQVNNTELPQIEKALNAYTRRLAYAKCLAKGGDRYDLDGNVSGEITKEEALRSHNNVLVNAEKMKIKRQNQAIDKKNQFEADLKKAAAKAAQEKAQETEKKTLSIKLPATKKTDNSTVVIKKKRTVIIPEK